MSVDTREKPLSKEDVKAFSTLNDPAPAREDKVESDQKVPDSDRDPNDPVGESALHYYPERRGGSFRSRNPLHSDSDFSRAACERSVLTVLKNYPLVKTIERAMRAHGCELDYRRHFSCEPCRGNTTGGYDTFYNQIVVCSNGGIGKSKRLITMAHEMIHMFDVCRAKLDYNNPEHVACTEIRAANLINCSYMDSVVSGATSPFKVENMQRECVRAKAFYSLKATYPNRDDLELLKTIDKVFDKCYADLEPLGRRAQSVKATEFAYRERFLHGAVE